MLQKMFANPKSRLEIFYFCQFPLLVIQYGLLGWYYKNISGNDRRWVCEAHDEDEDCCFKCFKDEYNCKTL